MAYFGTYYAGGNAMTSSCIDGVPFKLGPKFKPPTKVILPADLDLKAPSQSSLLQEEYSFEVEEAVLKWSAERERQLEEQQRHASERQASVRRSHETDSSDSGTEIPGEGANGTSSQPIYQNVSSDPNYENPGVLRPQPAPRSNIPKPVNSIGNPTYTAVTVPNPLIANISNDILQPTRITNNEPNVQNIKRSTSKEKRDFDVSLFEKEDDPFDNLELQTINDMEELASVLEETKKASPVMSNVNSGETADTNYTHSNGNVSLDKEGAISNTENDSEVPLYENSISSEKTSGDKTDEDSAPVFDIRKLPPIPPRRDLVGGSNPLPPIGRKSVDTELDKVAQSQILKHASEVSSLQTDNISVSSSFPKYDNFKTISPKPPVPKPPRTFKYSRHDLEDDTLCDSNANGSNENFHVQSRNSQSNPDLKSCVDGASNSQGLNFVNHHFGENSNEEGEIKTKPIPAPRRVPSPPPRPSSHQSWNRYSPLPDPVVSSSPEPVVPPRADAYTKLSNEARTSVDSLVTMGFSKDRVVRAVEKLGEDQKEVVEYLCLVDQLTEKGFDTCLAENALLLFQNSMLKASQYLELYKQFQELGFHGDKIKEALINTQNDREKSLDILTASS